jgi:hypothetical protein
MQTKPDNISEQAASKAEAELRDKINRETARLPWAELLKHFAAGNVVFVSNGLDLIDVAVRISHDDKASISAWMDEGRIAKVSDHQAETWLAANATLWAVVVSPFVLVQQAKGASPEVPAGPPHGATLH